MLCADSLSVVTAFIQDWQTLAIMSTVCRDWKAAVEAYAGPNYRMELGQYIGEPVYKLIVSYPSYVEFMYRECGQYILGKLLETIQPRVDLRYARMPYGKYKGYLIASLPHEYRCWIYQHCDDTHIKNALVWRRHGYFCIKRWRHTRLLGHRIDNSLVT